MTQIGSLIYQYELLQQDVIRLIDGLSENQWRWQPSPKDWSIALCINHINRVNSLVMPRVEQVIEQGRASRLFAEGPFHYPLFDRLFVFGMEPRNPAQSPVPRIYRPEDAPGYTQTRQEFLGLHTRVMEAVRAAKGLDWVRIKAASPVNERLRFSLGTWFKALLAHEQNHYQQARRVAERAGFPKSLD